MRDTILEQLDAIEREHDVTIVFACESGSRAWGFPSLDSDYDVRFVYARKLEWYLSISPGRDVIELPVGPILDINGWDVRKALQLLRKSNNSLLEWISSPIQYRCNEELFALFQSAVPHGFDKETSARHYLSMASANIKKIESEAVRMKQYLYTIRPLLCCRWVLEFETQPPMIFRELVSKYLADSVVGQEIEELIATKETQTEKDTIPKSEVLNSFIVKEFARLSALVPDDRELPDTKAFDEVFRKIIA